MENEIELELMPDGTVRYSRSDPDTNERTLGIIAEIAPSKTSEVREFLDGGKQIEVLFGGETFCG